MLYFPKYFSSCVLQIMCFYKRKVDKEIESKEKSCFIILTNVHLPLVN